MNKKLLKEIVHAELTRHARMRLKLLAVLAGKSAREYLTQLIHEQKLK